MTIDIERDWNEPLTPRDNRDFPARPSKGTQTVVPFPAFPDSVIYAPFVKNESPYQRCIRIQSLNLEPFPVRAVVVAKITHGIDNANVVSIVRVPYTGIAINVPAGWATVEIARTIDPYDSNAPGQESITINASLSTAMAALRREVVWFDRNWNPTYTFPFVVPCPPFATKGTFNPVGGSSNAKIKVLPNNPSSTVVFIDGNATSADRGPVTLPAAPFELLDLSNVAFVEWEINE